MDEEIKFTNQNDCIVICDICSFPIDACRKQKTEILCPRCEHKLEKHKSRDANKTLIFALTALIFYIPANLLPFMTIEMYGQKTESTIWQGIISLAEGGDMALALVVFLASMLVPFIKLVILFYLSFAAKNKKNQKFKTKLFHFIEVIGPWSMLDIFLLAVLVAVLKFGSMATVTVGKGSLMFLLVVIFTMMASSNFSTKLIWEEE